MQKSVCSLGNESVDLYHVRIISDQKTLSFSSVFLLQNFLSPRSSCLLTRSSVFLSPDSVLGVSCLFGGDGNDILDGVSLNLGVGEIDQLTGNLGADTFVLGNGLSVFYDDNANSFADSEAGQAMITDFILGEDAIALSPLGSYELVEVSGSTQILEISDSIPEVIATVEGVTGLNLADSNQFVFF